MVSFGHEIEGVYSFRKSWHFKAVANQFSMGTDGLRFTQFMLDGSIRYRPAKSKLEYELVLSNLTDVRDLRQYMVNSNYSMENYQRMRGRMVLGKVGFRF